MEFKVWSEGIQRVIFGVTEHTTCHDIVVALAQASRTTGRFTLVEKWRDSERFVAPDESPLMTLIRWGEYANDVQFILRHSGSKAGDQSNAEWNPKSGGFTECKSTSRRFCSSSSLRKSLTFSGVHSQPFVLKGENQKKNKDGSLNDNSSSSNQTDHSSQGSWSGLRDGSVYTPSLDTSRSTYQQLPSQSLSSSPASHHNLPVTNTSLPFGGSLERTRKRAPLGVKHTQQSSDSSTISPQRYIRDNNNISQFTKPESNNNIALKPDGNVRQKTVNRGAISDNNELTRKTKLLQLLSSQQDKLNSQDQSLKSLDSVISSIEHFDHDAGDDSPVYVEVNELEKKERGLDAELQELELVVWDEKLLLEKDKHERLLTEKQILYTQTNSCNIDLDQLNMKLHELVEEISRCNNDVSIHVQRDREQELRVLTEISDLQKQINTHLVKHEFRLNSIENLQGDVKKFESSILERKTQIADLEKTLKTTNMESFSYSHTSTDLQSNDGATMFQRVSPSRPGSARLLESPLKLKEAAPSLNNPQGLWV